MTSRAGERPRGRMVLLGTALLLLLAGAMFLGYPYGKVALFRVQAREAAAAFSQKAARRSKSENDLLYRAMEAYNRALFADGQAGLADAFSLERADFDMGAYGFDSRIIGTLTVPKLCRDLPVYLGAGGENLKQGAAHLSRTSLPVGGENTNAVIAAHRDMTGSDMFRHIDELVAGDLMTFRNFRETLTYRVVEVAVIAPDEIDRILIQPGRDMLTLLTCNPYGSNDQRYIVYGERVPGESDWTFDSDKE